MAFLAFVRRLVVFGTCYEVEKSIILRFLNCPIAYISYPL